MRPSINIQCRPTALMWLTPGAPVVIVTSTGLTDEDGVIITDEEGNTIQPDINPAANPDTLTDENSNSLTDELGNPIVPG